MSRSENIELRRKLSAAIWRLLCNKGLDATSYQDIANEAGVSRSLVQHYYPRKMDFAVDFLEGLLEIAATVSSIDAYARKETLTPLDAQRMGCLYYGYLLDENGARAVLFDILKNREFADELMRQHYEWALLNLNPTLPPYERRTEEVIMTWGGFYELMYASVKQGMTFDVPAKTLIILRAFLEQGEMNVAAINEANGYEFDRALLCEMNTLVRQRANSSIA